MDLAENTARQADAEPISQRSKSDADIGPVNLGDGAAKVAQLPAEYSGPVMREDALLGCLVILTRLFGNPRSPAALSAGLPIGKSGMTADLFIRACDRAGLASNKLKRPLDKLDSFSLPAVLLLKDQQACIVLNRPVDGKVEIATPESLDGRHKVSIEELERLYTGTFIVVRPKIRLDARTAEIAQAAPRNWFWSEVLQHTPIYGEVILAAGLINILAISTSLFSMQIYDRVLPNKAVNTLWVLAIGVITAYLFDLVLRTLRGYLLDRAGKGLDRKVSSSLFEHILQIKMAARPQSAGSFANNMAQYESLRDFFTSATMSALVDLPFLFVFLALIYVIAGSVVLVPMVLVPLVFIVSLCVQAPMRKAVERSYREQAQKHAVLIESLNGLDTIKASSAEGQLQRDWDGYVAASAQSAMSSRLWSTLGINFVMFASNLSSVLVLIVGSYLTFDGKMTSGAMVAASMLTGRAMAPLGQIAGLIIRFHQSWSSLKGLNRLMKMPVERPAGKVFLRRPNVLGEIEFRNVSFKYPNSETHALEGISFKIKPGERVGIVGRIGSGKTTIERLILGLYEPKEGAVLLDGTDIRQLDPTDLRQNIGCVLQDPHLFFGSVKDNIVLGAPYVDEESVIRAASMAGVDQFVRQHPAGYDMPVGEGGRQLSGGQRQSITLARALLLDPPILLLDEPTSSMDNSSENSLKERLATVCGGKTLILVTHRSSMLSLVDRLLVLDRGKIVADGPKSSVLDALMKGRIKANEI